MRILYGAESQQQTGKPEGSKTITDSFVLLVAWARDRYGGTLEKAAGKYYLYNNILYIINIIVYQITDSFLLIQIYCNK